MTTCGTPFEALNAYVDGELSPSAELNLRRHLDVCDACRAQVNGLLALKERVAATAETHAVPHTLRERLGDLERPAPRRGGRRLVIGVAVAVAVLAVLGTALWRSRSFTAIPVRVTEALVADHVHFLQEPNVLQVVAHDPAELATWFADKVHFPVRVPRLQNATLVGGRLCTLLDRKFALAFYETRGGRVSLFVGDAGALPAATRRGRVPTAALGNYHVAIVPWKDAALALVADADQTAAVLPELVNATASP